MRTLALSRPANWRLLALAVLLLAAALRWAEPGLVEYKYDEAHITGLALAVARGGDWPLLSGGTTLGIPRSAFDVYLLAAPLALAQRPEAAVWMTGALGVLAVALIYALGSRVAGGRVGLLAALYMAVNPWLVSYDRKLWAHIQVVFSVALLLAAWEVQCRGRQKAAFWFPVLAALQLLSHVLALVQLLSWLGAIMVAPRRWANRWLGWGMLVGFLLLAPYVWALLSQIGGGLPKLPNAVALDVASDRWSFARQMFGGNGIAGLTGLSADANLWWRWSGGLAWFVLALIAFGGVRLALWTRRSSDADGARLLLVWLAGPLLALGLAPLRIYPQYWTALLPLPALLFALGLDDIVAGVEERWAAGRRRTTVRAVVGASVAIIVAVWIGSYAAMLGAIAAGFGAQAFGIPLQRWQETLTSARSWAEQLGTDQVRVAVRGVDPGQEGDPAAVATLIGNPPFARFVAPTSPAALLLAEGQESLYLWTIDDPATEVRLAALGEGVWEGSLAQGLPPARLYRLPPAQAVPLDLVRLQPAPVFDVGLELIGYHFPDRPQAGAPIEVTLVWRVLAPSPDARTRDLTAFNHILAAGTEERVAQVDGLALLSRDWWPGDVLIQPYQVQLPAGEYVWRVGLYSRVDGSRAQLNTGGDAIDLGPFEVTR